MSWSGDWTRFSEQHLIEPQKPIINVHCPQKYVDKSQAPTSSSIEILTYAHWLYSTNAAISYVFQYTHHRILNLCRTGCVSTPVQIYLCSKRCGQGLQHKRQESGRGWHLGRGGGVGGARREGLRRKESRRRRRPASEYLGLEAACAGSGMGQR